MRTLKTIMLVLILVAGISIIPVAGSSLIYVYRNIHAVSLEELALTEAPCPDSEHNQGSSQLPVQSNPLPSVSIIADPYIASDKPHENLVVWQNIRPLTGKELALAEASCPFGDDNLFAFTIASSDKSQIALSHRSQNSLSGCSPETGLNKVSVMNACKIVHRLDFAA